MPRDESSAHLHAIPPAGILGTYEALVDRRWHLPRPYPLLLDADSPAAQRA